MEPAIIAEEIAADTDRLVRIIDALSEGDWGRSGTRDGREFTVEFLLRLPAARRRTPLVRRLIDDGTTGAACSVLGRIAAERGFRSLRTRPGGQSGGAVPDLVVDGEHAVLPRRCPPMSSQRSLRRTDLPCSRPPGSKPM